MPALTLFVGTTGSGGKLYASGLSTSRRRRSAPRCQADSPHPRRTGKPPPCPFRAVARRAPGRFPEAPQIAELIESVGQALAQAGSMSSFRRS